MTASKKTRQIKTARQVLLDLGLPRAQQNDRSALCLLALLNLTPGKPWHEAEESLIGITPIMAWVQAHYNRKYAPNTRETFRRQTLHQFCAAGFALYNPDNSSRPVNSPKSVYQIEPHCLALLRTAETPAWQPSLAAFLAEKGTLVARYAKDRDQVRVPVKMTSRLELSLSPGEHSELIRAILESFAPRFAPESDVVYVGDSGNKWSHLDSALLARLGVSIDSHGKMPDVILYDPSRNWLLLIEAVTSHGPVDGKRHAELSNLFAESTAGLVFVTAFPSRSSMGHFLSEIAWETEVWVAEAPSHLIHFNGARFLGPYEGES